MSFQTFVTQRLAALTAMINAINTNGKNINELPAQSTLIPTSKIHVSNNGTSESLQIQQIIDAVETIQSNRLVTVGAISLVGNTLTIGSEVKALIDGILCVKNTDTVINIPFSEAGKTRIDIVVIDSTSQVVKITGQETAGIAVQPTLPIDAVLITEINVTDNSVGNTDPITGEIDPTASHNKGYYNIVTNTPTLVNGVGNIGDYVVCTVPGTRDFGAGNITVGATDQLEYNGSVWFKSVDNNQTIDSNVTTTVTQITSAVLSTNDVYGMREYINALNPIIAIPSNEIRCFEITNTGQIFKLLLRGRSFGFTESPISISDIKEEDKEVDFYKSWFSYMANNAGAFLSVNTNNPLTVSGTASVVARGGTTIYNSIIMNNYASAATNGSNAGIKNNNASDGTYLEGADAYFIFTNNDTDNQCCNSVGFYSLLTAIPNLNPTDFTANTVIVANDSGDANYSFFINRTGITPSFLKIPCGNDFPAHSTTDAYLFRIQINRTTDESKRQAKLTLRNLITGKIFSYDLNGNQLPEGSANFAVVASRNNRNTGAVRNFRVSKIHVTRKLY